MTICSLSRFLRMNPALTENARRQIEEVPTISNERTQVNDISPDLEKPASFQERLDGRVSSPEVAKHLH